MHVTSSFVRVALISAVLITAALLGYLTRRFTPVAASASPAPILVPSVVVPMTHLLAPS
jgi:hypothetical protein